MATSNNSAFWCQQYYPYLSYLISALYATFKNMSIPVKKRYILFSIRVIQKHLETIITPFWAILDDIHSRLFLR